MTAPKRRRSRWLLTLVKALVSAGLIYWLLGRTNLADVYEAMRRVHFPLLVGAFLLNFVGYAISISRWRVLLRAQDHPAPIVFLIQSYMTGIFFNNVLPSTIGGDTVRAYDSWRLGGDKARAVAIIFVDRLTGMTALAAFAVFGLFLFQTIHDGIPYLTVVLPGVLAATGLVVWAVFSPSMTVGSSRWFGGLPAPLRRVGRRLASGLSAFRGKGRALIAALALSATLQINVVLHYFLIAESLGLGVPFLHFLFIIPVALAIMAIPLSINAIGIRENVFVFFFALYGIAAGDALAFAWLAYLVLLVHGVLGGLVYALRR